MKKYSSNHLFYNFPTTAHWISILFIVLVSTGYITYKYYDTEKSLQKTRRDLSQKTLEMQSMIDDLTNNLASTTEEKIYLKDVLTIVQARNTNFENQIQEISATVGALYKLSQTDEELLQKYSSIYFLNENYTPSALSDINTIYLQRKDKAEKIHTTIKPYLEALLQDINTNGTALTVLSAYRSFGTQTTLKNNYKIQYGTTAANKFSADQGYSEHQLGSTVDFTTPENGENLSKFENTKSYEWLLQNAYKYGFVLSYPKGNKFYQFEPWHWRFVGVELATKLHNENKYFYDLDQREINTYLGKIFN
ncbi:MAG: M15 family metallopeptidase [Minisyncoccota bacterium]